MIIIASNIKQDLCLPHRRACDGWSSSRVFEGEITFLPPCRFMMSCVSSDVRCHVSVQGLINVNLEIRYRNIILPCVSLKYIVTKFSIYKSTQAFTFIYNCLQKLRENDI